ncbi:hypothetical protein [Paraburkholderia sediminicola]|uniref:hypothetical protein n=1 Tax=Paraburkholderia sediminicola TaxID=458836 RepID=UPI0038B7DA82
MEPLDWMIDDGARDWPDHTAGGFVEHLTRCGSAARRSGFVSIKAKVVFVDTGCE